MKDTVRIGTCSWKYDSWRGIIYPEQGAVNHLREYSYYYDTVEVDQWFWSLFRDDKVVLPKADIVREYADSIPDDFTFCIKVPNSVTLTHHYNKDKKAPLQQNPYFLSVDLMNRFLESIEALEGHIGPLIFQFEYLNKKKMPGRQEFFDRFTNFVQHLPSGYLYCMEIRNPNYLGEDYFAFLNDNGLKHVFLHGYYMPSIFEVYQSHKDRVSGTAIIRLHGPDRNDIDKQTRNRWNRIIAPKDNDIDRLADMLSDLDGRNVRSYVYVNNHFEGSAPRTISRIQDRRADKKQHR